MRRVGARIQESTLVILPRPIRMHFRYQQFGKALALAWAPATVGCTRSVSVPYYTLLYALGCVARLVAAKIGLTGRPRASQLLSFCGRCARAVANYSRSRLAKNL
jgi:hypothetical protein